MVRGKNKISCLKYLSDRMGSFLTMAQVWALARQKALEEVADAWQSLLQVDEILDF